MLIASSIYLELLLNQWLFVRFYLFIHEEIIDPIRFPVFSSCCKDDYRFAVVWFNILKDDLPLYEVMIYHSFVNLDKNNNDTILKGNGLFASGESYAIN